MRRVLYVFAVGVVAAAAAMMVRSGADRGPSPQEVRAAEERAAMAAINERTRARAELAGALVRGELTVPQAVAEFRDLLADDPWGLRGLWAKYPNAPLDELAAHQVAEYVLHRTVGDPYRKADLVRQLDALAPSVRAPSGRDITVSRQ